MPPNAEELRSSLIHRLQTATFSTDRRFSMLAPETMTSRPIRKPHRTVFYLGHLEAFDWNRLARTRMEIDYVMKGGFSRTAASILRRSFRNGFQSHYPHIYSTFRLVEA
jgi:hypothetical protein